MVKLIKCIVRMNRLRLEQFDSNGKAVVIEKQDMFGTQYPETQEVTYRRGDTVSLPEAVIKKLGKSVEMVMVPQVEEPVVSEQTIPADGELKSSGRERTVAEIIPKDKDEKGSDAKPSSPKGKDKGNDK